nr:hypothetical protein [Tanacetum cinerariifolium]
VSRAVADNEYPFAIATIRLQRIARRRGLAAVWREKQAAVCDGSVAVSAVRLPPSGRRGAGSFWQLPTRADEMAGVAVGDSLQVILMLWFGFPERPGLYDLSDNFARPQARGIDVRHRVQRYAFLLFVEVEDRRTIARAPVVALAIRRGGVMNLEKEFEDLAVADDRRIEDDFDGFGVVAMIEIRGIRCLAARVTHTGRQYPGIAAQQILHAPEATSGQQRGFGMSGHG